MVWQMERGTMQLMAKRGKSIRQIAKELGRNRRTVARALQEPADRTPAPRRRASAVDLYRPHIERWITEGLTAVRMLELARSAEEQPYTGSRSNFGAMVRRVRAERDQQQAADDVPIRFEGLPAEYLQVDWGEVRDVPFASSAPEGQTRYFLACRLTYSRWSWVRFTTDMRQETLVRGLVDCLAELGWVPWVLVFDNMKTVTRGRDASGQPLWTPGLLQRAGEFGFHPQACDPGAGNQKGAVEALVKWAKGNFLPGRVFADDADLAAHAREWQGQVNARPSAATGLPPTDRVPVEAAEGGPLPPTEGVSWLSRRAPGTAVYTSDGARWDVLDLRDAAGTPTVERDGALGVAQRLPACLLAARVPAEAPNQRRRRVRAEARAGGVRPVRPTARGAPGPSWSPASRPRCCPCVTPSSCCARAGRATCSSRCGRARVTLTRRAVSSPGASCVRSSPNYSPWSFSTGSSWSVAGRFLTAVSSKRPRPFVSTPCPSPVPSPVPRSWTTPSPSSSAASRRVAASTGAKRTPTPINSSLSPPSQG